MLGQGVTRIAGWDTHGLPVEIEVEKALNINGKREIEAYGIERFNKLCRESVFKYKADWESLSDRIGYWLDYEHPYITYTNNYIETVWWLLKRLHEKSLLYRGHKVCRTVRAAARRCRRTKSRRATRPCRRIPSTSHSRCSAEKAIRRASW